MEAAKQSEGASRQASQAQPALQVHHVIALAMTAHPDDRAALALQALDAALALHRLDTASCAADKLTGRGFVTEGKTTTDLADLVLVYGYNHEQGRRARDYTTGNALSTEEAISAAWFLSLRLEAWSGDFYEVMADVRKGARAPLLAEVA